MRKVAMVVVCALLASRAAWAHRIDEYLQATILSLEGTRASASMQLIPGTQVASSVIAVIDSNHDGFFSESEKRAYADRVLRDLSVTADGQTVKPQLDSWTVPDASELQDGLGEISIHYHVDLPLEGSSNRSLILENHHLNGESVYLVNVEVPEDHNFRVVDQRRNEWQSVYKLDYEQVGGVDGGLPRALGSWLSGVQLSSLFRLGMRHIAEGTDHLLFLLVLLLPAPLLAAGSRWGQARGVRPSLGAILKIVTAFTVGHSLTLSLAAMNLVHVPERAVEVLIAVSILVSAIHALRPIFPGREAWIAAFFGLIHGLAFAATLGRLGLSHWDRVAGIFAFNLGIETMQLVVVAGILPSLLIMSRTKLYTALRIAGALVAGVASIAWILQRVFNVQTHVDAVANMVAQNGAMGACGFFVASVVYRFFLERSTRAAGLERVQGW